MASISFRHIYKVYPRTEKETEKLLEKGLSPFAVKDFNLEVEDGEFVVLVGPSGCGKSTTLRMVAGLESISSGELYIDDVLANDVDASKRNIAMVFQNYALYPHMTTYQNMSYSLKIRKVPYLVMGIDKNGIKAITKQIKILKKKDPQSGEIKVLTDKLDYLKTNEVEIIKYRKHTKEEIDEKVKAAAELLGITDLLDRKPSEMSGGQRQRVALGRALVRDPKVFLLDEPLSNLDAKLRASMRSEIVNLYHRVKTTFLYVTHDQVEAMTMGTRIVVMKDGVVQQVDTPSNIFDKPVNKFVAGFIGTPQMNFFDAKIKTTKKDITITLEDGYKIKHPLTSLRAIKEEYLDGKEHDVIVGVRGEHLKIGEVGLSATVKYTENLGNDTIVLADISTGKGFNISCKERTIYNTGDVIKVSFEASDIHLFDMETENTIYKE